MTHPSHRSRVESAIADPTREFARPMDVASDPVLDSNEKRLILNSWLKDAELLSAAQAENMTGGEHAHLHEVKMALAQLDTTISEHIKV